MQLEISPSTGPSAFAQSGFRRTIASLLKEIAELYRSDAIPWVVGYSGGKDSTATLQLVWLALSQLPEEERRKPRAGHPDPAPPG